jgi:two-component system alkaline phosphatase synthesis response regulator PhoP
MTNLTRHVIIAAERTPMWREFAHHMLAEGVEYAWVPDDTPPADFPGELPPPPTVVIIDLAADQPRGIALVGACRAARHPVPVIVVAANPGVDLVRQLRLAGVFYLALHPVTSDEMLGIVANAFQCLAREQHDTSSCRGPRRILIVDDDADYVRSMTSLLESRGYVVASARSGKEGLEKLRADPPDLVVLDVMMEYESSGYEVNQTVKFAPSFEGFHHVPIVMVSSIPLDPATRFHMAGEVDTITPNRYMTKPIDIPRFLANVRELLGEPDTVTA